MEESFEMLKLKGEMMALNMQKIAETVHHLISPINAIRLYVDDIIEDPDFMEIKDRLATLDKAAERCMIIIKQLADLAMPYLYYRPGSDK